MLHQRSSMVLEFKVANIYARPFVRHSRMMLDESPGSKSVFGFPGASWDMLHQRSTSVLEPKFKNILPGPLVGHDWPCSSMVLEWTFLKIISRLCVR